ncbi:MAG: hypothetical protein ACFFG0_47500 [Candidatus Thorarchaeota archaeon]
MICNFIDNIHFNQVIKNIQDSKKYHYIWDCLVDFRYYFTDLTIEIYLSSVRDSIYDEYAWGIEIFFSYALAFMPLIVGITVLYRHMKGEMVVT